MRARGAALDDVMLPCDVMEDSARYVQRSLEEAGIKQTRALPGARSGPHGLSKGGLRGSGAAAVPGREGVYKFFLKASSLDTFLMRQGWPI